MSESLPQREPDQVDAVATDLDSAPTTAEYKQNVQAMKHELDARATASHDYDDSWSKVRTKYVVEEKNPLLGQFNEVMLHGPYDLIYEKQVQYYRSLKAARKKEGKKLSDAETEAKRVALMRTIKINHSIRDMLRGQAGNFTSQEFADMYSTFLHGNQALAESRAIGNFAEIAVGNAAASMDELDGVRDGTPEEDSRGGDTVARRSSDLKLVMIDAKAGRQLPVGREDATGIYLTIGIPNEYFDTNGRVDSKCIEHIQTAITFAMQHSKAAKTMLNNNRSGLTQAQ